MNTDIFATRCEEYDPVLIRDRISKHLDRHEKFRDPKGKSVLIKINLLSASDPRKAVTTHPAFVEGLSEELKARGARVTIGDSPGGPFNKRALENAYEKTGMYDISKKHGVDLNYNTSSHVEKLPQGNMIKRFNVCDYLQEHDLVIATPKIKTHMFAGLTCCSKIMFGAIPGIEKVSYHTRFPDMDDFARMLLDLTDLTMPDLFLIDGIVGMDKKGPSWGRTRKVGVIISGTDNKTLDLYVSRMVGLDPETLPVTREVLKRMNIDPELPLEAEGDAADYRLEKSYKPASGFPLATNPPRFLSRFLVRMTTGKPKINKKNGAGCGVCRENCAGSAIRIVKKKAKIDYSKCIRCYCCHELCPHDAVKISRFM